MKIIKKITAAAAVVSMTAALALPCAVTAEETYIYIRTSADMKDLADKCLIDSYSVDKVVVLDCDIDLSGTDFEYIPYFSGTFDGNGYTISGISLEVSDPERGFIGTIGENGTVKNLNVTGKIEENTKKEDKKPSEEGIRKIIEDLDGGERGSVDRFFSDTGVYSVGGIAGINKGTIINCGFNGSVQVNKNAGGIAGVNEGRIEGSSNYAEVKGNENTGGIAGKNTGIVKWSKNYGRINDQAVEGMYATGGICGYSEGVVFSCSNCAEIGYKNTGSATGGIAGAQSGHISECENTGMIYGKKRVGGIVGNFEPYTNITYNPDEIQDKIDEEKERIKNDLDDISARLDSNREKIKEDLDSFDSRLKNVFGIDDITGSLDEVTSSLANLNNTVSDKIAGGSSLASMADTLARAESDLSANNGEVKAFLAQARESAKTMSETTDELASSISESNGHINEVMDSISGNLSDSERRENVNNAIESLDKAINSTSSAMDHLATLKMPNLNVGVDVLEDTDRQLARMLDRINDRNEGVLDDFISIGKIFGDIKSDLAERKQKLQELKTKLEEWLKAHGDTKPTIRPLPSELPVVTEAPQASAWGLFGVTAYAADDKNDKTTLERLLDMDIHDMDIPLDRDICGENYEMAVVRYSVNSGTVAGNSDIGGISGGVGFGVSVGGSFANVNSDGKEFSLNPSTAIKSVISTCINEGEISAKNTSAGGITGFSDLGKVKDCINVGYVAVTDGSYSGGISGYNRSDIMRCINTGDVDAESDIGGIAGSGRNISQTYALTRTASSGERRGAVAGTADGELEHNYFLKEKLGGINGVDYSDRAQSVAKEVLAVDGDISSELSGLEDRYWTGTSGDLYMPQLRAFTENTAESSSDLLKAKSAACALFRFTVDFRIDGESVKTINLDYGENIPKNEIPEIPKVNGKYGSWDKKTDEPIIRNTKFTAVYDKSKSTLSYGGEPPIILVEGDFNPDAQLVVEEFNGASIINDSRYDVRAAYGMMVLQNDKKYDGDVRVHVRVPKNGKDIKIGLVTDNAVVITDCERDGSYVIFSPGGAERFIVLETHKSVIPWIIIGMLLIAAVVLGIIFRKRLKEKMMLIKEAERIKNLPLTRIVLRLKKGEESPADDEPHENADENQTAEMDIEEKE